MDLNAINLNVNRLLSNIWAVITFLKEFTVDEAKDVSITHINNDGSESVKSFPNISKQLQNLEEWKNSFSMDSVEYSTGSSHKHIPTPAKDTYFDLPDVKIEIPKNGKWLVTYNVRMWQSNSATYFWKKHRVTLNNEEVIKSRMFGLNKYNENMNADSSHSKSFIVDAKKGDILQLQGYWNSYVSGNTNYSDVNGTTNILAIRLGG